MSARDVRVYMCKRVLYTKAIVYTFTKLYDRGIPNVGVGVRVGVGPVEFQLKCPHSKWKTTRVMSTKFGTRVAHGLKQLMFDVVNCGISVVG